MIIKVIILLAIIENFKISNTSASAETLDLMWRNKSGGVMIETNNHYSLRHISEDAIKYCNMTTDKSNILKKLKNMCGTYNISYHCRDKDVFFEFVYYANFTCIPIAHLYRNFKCVENLTDFYKCETSILEYPYVITVIFFSILFLLLLLSPIFYLVHKKLSVL